MEAKRIRGPDGTDLGAKLINMISRVDENIKGTLENTLEELANVLEQNLEPYEGQVISILSEWLVFILLDRQLFTVDNHTNFQCHVFAGKADHLHNSDWYSQLEIVGIWRACKFYLLGL